MKRILIALFCLTLLISLVGCKGEKEQTPDETEEIVTSETEEITKEPDTGEAVEPKEPEGYSEEASVSLNNLRQAMVGTGEMFAAAYLGYIEDEPTASGVRDWLKENYPQLCGDLPFVSEIPDSNIVGDKWGELFCIVPLDEMATLALNRLDEGGEVAEVLYRSEVGDPILVFCNSEVVYQDKVVYITDNNGNSTEWYPGTKDYYGLEPVTDENGVSLMHDFSPVDESLRREYNAYREMMWKTPEAVDLVDTSWEFCGFTSDGREVLYSIDIGAKNVEIMWNDGIDEENHYFTATWSYKNVDGVGMMEIDLANLDGIRNYCVLLTAEHNMIYLAQDFINGDIRDYEDASRILERSYG